MSMKHIKLQSDEKIIDNPNLPVNRVSLAVISSAAKMSIEKLHTLNIKTVEINPHRKLYKSVATHSDLRLLHLPNKSLLCHKDEIANFSKLSDFAIEPIYENIGELYPDDVRLNCAIIGNRIICNRKTISKTVLEYAEINDYIVIDTKQGYTKCSVCVLNENAIITDDVSIYKSAQNYFDDVLLISKGSIVLKAANYGFIGGCTGKLSKNEIAFNGRIESHTDSNRIIDILSKYNIIPIELTDGVLEDIGGILPLAEYIL